MPTETTAPRRRARVAVTLAFLVHGLVGTAWVARIPQIKQELGLGEGALGVALLGAPLGVFFAVRIAGRAVARWGSRATSLATGAGGALVLVPLGFAWDLPSLTGALFLLGMGLGMMDVAMNAQGVAVERAYERPIMSGLHGSYSVGTLLAALVGAGAAQAGVPVPAHLSAMAVVLAAVLLLGGRGMLGPAADVTPEPAGGGTAGAGRAARVSRWTLPLLGVIGLCSFVGEGAMADWSAVYLREDLGTAPGTAGLGFAGCAVAMTVGRLAGDRVVHRFGPVRVLRAGSLVGSLGLGLGLVAHHPVAAVAGFTLFGLGIAVVAPVTFSAAGNLPGVPAATGIGRVTAVGYLGLLGGPPVIGFVAEGLGLPWALAVPAVLAGAIVALAGATAAADR
ncbi:MFS transporter [Actinomadura kijaniata]|uniref:MFS transporter n=1 Tax=Actinomadura kijaniata TaxID=46161 RepID=UPI00082D5130|nr:MFS transporter [Actinomadura kijaniata]